MTWKHWLHIHADLGKEATVNYATGGGKRHPHADKIDQLTELSKQVLAGGTMPINQSPHTSESTKEDVTPADVYWTLAVMRVIETKSFQ
jgi:hypothetical protein